MVVIIGIGCGTIIGVLDFEGWGCELILHQVTYL